MAQLPWAGMTARLSVTVFAVLVSFAPAPAPAQVVAGANGLDDALDEVAMLRLAGSVSVRFACVRSKAFKFDSVIVSVDTAFSAMLAGLKDSVTTGAAAANDSAAGQAVLALPAVVGVIAGAVIAPATLTDKTAVSTAPDESVTVSVMVPALPVGMTVACAAPAPDCTVTPPLAVQE